MFAIKTMVAFVLALFVTENKSVHVLITDLYAHLDLHITAELKDTYAQAARGWPCAATPG